MFKYLCPDLYIPSVLEIRPEKLKKMGIRGVICDMDNTIIPWDEDLLAEEIILWFESLKSAGLRICLLSNGLQQRVHKIAQILDIDAIPIAVKPRKIAFYKALDKLSVEKDKVVVIGDQIFTDILGGNRLGLQTILVQPLGEKELFWTLFLRQIERLVLRRLQRQGLFPREID